MAEVLGLNNSETGQSYDMNDPSQVEEFNNWNNDRQNTMANTALNMSTQETQQEVQQINPVKMELIRRYKEGDIAAGDRLGYARDLSLDPNSNTAPRPQITGVRGVNQSKQSYSVYSNKGIGYINYAAMGETDTSAYNKAKIAAETGDPNILSELQKQSDIGNFYLKQYDYNA
ncbi:MAG: hypothetical protein LBM09_00535 [Candidatus Nomurabacteria bacterium]|jgi:hypothetical protein|nr:hypothetical protein [Candidatus Nomurabacteria bacterium]